MQGLSLFKGVLVALATVGVVFPQARVMAASKATAARPAVRIAATGEVMHISTAKTGAFGGRVVDHNGTPIKDAQVIIRRDSKEVARTTTNDRGVFQVKHVEDGRYEVVSGNTVANYQVWNGSTAPVTSSEAALLVYGEDGARGQWGGTSWDMLLLTAAVLAAIIIAVIALNKDNNNNYYITPPSQSL
jgi:hypothetical protein